MNVLSYLNRRHHLHHRHCQRFQMNQGVQILRFYRPEDAHQIVRILKVQFCRSCLAYIVLEQIWKHEATFCPKKILKQNAEKEKEHWLLNSKEITNTRKLDRSKEHRYVTRWKESIIESPIRVSKEATSFAILYRPNKSLSFPLSMLSPESLR